MKLPAEPESMRAETEIRGVRICMVVVVRGEILGGSLMVLTAGRGGQMGQLVMI